MLRRLWDLSRWRRKPAGQTHGKTHHKMWRQGDIFFEEVKSIPARSKTQRLPHGVIAHGEVTGHTHKIENNETAGLFFSHEQYGEFYLEVTAPEARIVHEEHGPIALETGTYRVWRQREYSPEAIRYVYD